MKKIISFIIIFTITFSLYAQDGGDNVYKFLDIPTSARISALGGNNISHIHGDLDFVQNNPAMLRSSMDNKFILSYTNYVSDINIGYAVYAKNFKNVGIFSAGLQYMNYGKFKKADEYGEISGNFSAADYALNISYSYPIKKFNFGGSFKTIVSDYWEASSFGLALDLGATYTDTAKLFSAGMVIKNLGFQIKSYTKGVREQIPFDVQLGFTKKFSHAPLAISITAQDLTNWNLSYESTLSQNNISETDKNFLNKVGDIGDEIMRHFIIGADIIIGNNFYLSIGYNYKRRSELSISTKPKIVGFSAGFGLNLKKFGFEYSYSSYHLAGAINYVSLKINLNNIYKKN